MRREGVRDEVHVFRCISRSGLCSEPDSEMHQCSKDKQYRGKSITFSDTHSPFKKKQKTQISLENKSPTTISCTPWQYILLGACPASLLMIYKIM